MYVYVLACNRVKGYIMKLSALSCIEIRLLYTQDTAESRDRRALSEKEKHSDIMMNN